MTKLKDDEILNNDIWFASAPFGFTRDSSKASVDAQGVPIIAPGHWQALVRRTSKERAAAIVDNLMDEVWEHYLDLQERTFELVEQLKAAEELNTTNPHNAPALRRAYDENQYQKQGVAEAIALVEYTHLWKTDRGEAMAKVIAEARARYDASVGEE